MLLNTYILALAAWTSIGAASSSTPTPHCKSAQLGKYAALSSCPEAQHYCTAYLQGNKKDLGQYSSSNNNALLSDFKKKANLTTKRAVCSCVVRQKKGAPATKKKTTTTTTKCTSKITTSRSKATTSPLRTITTSSTTSSTTSTTTTTSTAPPLPTDCTAPQAIYCSDNGGADRSDRGCLCGISAQDSGPVCYGPSGCPNDTSESNPACATDQDCVDKMAGDRCVVEPEDSSFCPGGTKCVDLSTCGQDAPASLRRRLELMFEKEERRKRTTVVVK